MLKTTARKPLLHHTLHGEAVPPKLLSITTLTLHGHGDFLWDGATHIMDSDGDMADTGVIPDTDGATLDTGDLLGDGEAIQDTGEDPYMDTDTTIMLITMEEEALHLTTVEETTATEVTATEVTVTETIPTEATVTEATAIETLPIPTETTATETSQTEVTVPTEVTLTPTDEATIPISEEVHLQTEEPQQVLRTPTELIHKVKTIVLIIQTEDLTTTAQQTEPITTTTARTALQPEVTLQVHHVQ